MTFGQISKVQSGLKTNSKQDSCWLQEAGSPVSRVNFQSPVLHSIIFPGNWTWNVLDYLQFLGSKAITKFPLLSHRITFPELWENKHPKWCPIHIYTNLEMVVVGCLSFPTIAGITIYDFKTILVSLLMLCVLHATKMEEPWEQAPCLSSSQLFPSSYNRAWNNMVPNRYYRTLH